MLIADLLTCASTHRAVVDREQDLSYGAVRDRILRLSAFVEAYTARGDAVGVVVASPVDAVTTILGVLAAGRRCAPFDPTAEMEELRSLSRSVGANAMLHDRGWPSEAGTPDCTTGVFRLGDGRPELALTQLPAAVRRPASPTDVGSRLILLTSGTSGKPRPVSIDSMVLDQAISAVASTLSLTEDDRCLDVMPLHHTLGLVTGALAPLATGGSVFFGRQRDGIESILTCTRDFKPTWIPAVPAVFEALVRAVGHGKDAAASLTSLRFVRTSGAPMRESLAREIEMTLGVPVIEAYAMTEAPGVLTTNPLSPGQRVLGTVGRAPDGTRVRVVDAARVELEPGLVGEVEVAGPTVAIVRADTDDGWLRTGDRGCLDEAGYLRLLGRTDEMINRGGAKVAPQEIDRALAGHPDIERAAAFGYPHPSLGEQVAVAIVPSPGRTLDLRDIRTIAAERLPLGKIPTIVFFCDATGIPVTKTGKVRRTELARRYIPG